MAVDYPPHPLTEEHLQQINDGIAAIEYAKRQIALAKKADIDVAQSETEANAALEKLRKIKAVYFPNR